MLDNSRAILNNARNAVENEIGIIDGYINYKSKLAIVVIADPISSEKEKELISRLSDALNMKVLVNTPPVFMYDYRLPNTWQFFEDEDFTLRFDKMSISTSALKSMRQAITELSQACREVDHVVTFARGGIFLLEDLVRKEFGPNNMKATEQGRAKYHLFPCLPCRTEDEESTRSFFEWLDGLPSGKKVLLIDTSICGEGGTTSDRICLALKEYFKSRPIDILHNLSSVIVTSHQDSKPEPCTIYERYNTGKYNFSISFLHVEDLIGEDVNTMLGVINSKYTQALMPIKAPCLLELKSSRTGDIVTIVASDSLANAYAALPSNDQINESGSAKSIYENVVCFALGNYLEDFENMCEGAKAIGVITQLECDELVAYTREHAGDLLDVLFQPLDAFNIHRPYNNESM